MINDVRDNSWTFVAKKYSYREKWEQEVTYIFSTFAHF